MQLNHKDKGTKKRKKNFPLIFLFIILSLFFIAYVYHNRGLLIAKFGQNFGYTEFVLPSPRDFQVIKTIGNTEYVKWLDDGRHYFRMPGSFSSINSHAISHVVKNEYIYLHEKQMGGSTSIQDGVHYYFLTYYNKGKHLRKYYTKIEDMPAFAKINSETGDTWWFHNYEEMNTEDRRIFQELLEKEQITDENYDEKNINSDTDDYII
jgi:hypothetical protein